MYICVYIYICMYVMLNGASLQQSPPQLNTTSHEIASCISMNSYIYTHVYIYIYTYIYVYIYIYTYFRMAHCRSRKPNNIASYKTVLYIVYTYIFIYYIHIYIYIYISYVNTIHHFKQQIVAVEHPTIKRRLIRDHITFSRQMTFQTSYLVKRILALGLEAG